MNGSQSPIELKARIVKSIEKSKKNISSQIYDTRLNFDPLKDHLDKLGRQTNRFYRESFNYIVNRKAMGLPNIKAEKEYYKGWIYDSLLTLVLLFTLLSSPIVLLLFCLQKLIRYLIILIEVTIFDTIFEFSTSINALIVGLLILENVVWKLDYYYEFIFLYMPWKILSERSQQKFMNVFNLYVPFA